MSDFKQEILEQAALKWFMTTNKHKIIFNLGWIKIFEAGAKWQQEKMYSEEDILNFLDYLESNYYYNSSTWLNCETDEWKSRKDIIKLWQDNKNK